MNTVFLLMAQFNTATLGVRNLATLMGVEPRTIENQIQRGDFPIKTFKLGSKSVAHIQDVATHIDKCRGIEPP